MMNPIPSAEQQLIFLTKIENLLAEGAFTSSYKFALLLALTHIACTCPSGQDGQLVINKKQLGKKFLELYWQQAQPYKTSVLSQNTGPQAKIIADIIRYRNRSTIGSLSKLYMSDTKGIESLIKSIADTVFNMPVKYLQNSKGYTNEFLYAMDSVKNGNLTLLPGVAYCLSKFSGFIQRYAQQGWVNFVRGLKNNFSILSPQDDLEAFLFSSTRESLKIINEGLKDLDNNHCFYCGRKIKDMGDVDHFVPFSMISYDLGHNFVLACSSCNRSKSDVLASEQHLEHWLDHIDKNKEDLVKIATNAGIICDYSASINIAKWAYERATNNHQMLWQSSKKFVQINASAVQLITHYL